MNTRLPRPAWLAWLRLLLPPAAALLVFFLLGPGKAELPAGMVAESPFAKTRAVERAWVDQALPADYVATLVVEPPCRLEDPPSFSRAAFAAFEAKDEQALSRLAADNPGSWLPPLLWSQLLIESGARPRALEVLRRFASGPSYKRLAEQTSLPEDDLRAMIHFWHRVAVLQHETHSHDAKIFWQSLKNPIGRVKILAGAGSNGLPRDAPTWDQHRLPAPGCTSTRLSSFDLYNNLLVAYLEVPGFQEVDRRRQVEFARAYSDPPAQNPWQAALEKARRQELSRREGFVWAISNAERLLRDRRANRLGLPDHGPLALNLALLASEAAPLVPSLRESFWREIGELIDRAGAGDASPEFASSLTRLRLLRQIEQPFAGQVPQMKVPVPPGAGDETAETATRLAASTAARRDPATTERLLRGDQQLPALGDAEDDWLEALRQDVAAQVAAAVPAEASPAERQAALRQARGILRGASPPPEVDDLASGLPLSTRFAAGWRSLPARFALAMAAAALFFALGHLAERELRFRLYLWTSFYRREAEGINRP
jgi:hypothetical protein